MNYYLVCNNGTLANTLFARKYPYHLLLAPILVQNSLALQAAQQLCKMKGNDIILDNGAYEGYVMNITEYVQLTLQLRPHVAVALDLIGVPHQNSLEHSWDTTAALRTAGYEGLVMIIPQGTDKKDTLKGFQVLFRTLSRMPASDYIVGVGKCYEYWGSNEAARFEMWKDIQSLQYASQFNYHILGARQGWPSSTFFTSSCIRGLDTAKPVKCAYNGLIYPQAVPTKVGGAFNRLSPIHVLSINLQRNVEAFCKCYGVTFPKLHSIPFEEIHPRVPKLYCNRY